MTFLLFYYTACPEKLDPSSFDIYSYLLFLLAWWVVDHLHGWAGVTTQGKPNTNDILCLEPWRTKTHDTLCSTAQYDKKYIESAHDVVGSSLLICDLKPYSFGYMIIWYNFLCLYVTRTNFWPPEWKCKQLGRMFTPAKRTGKEITAFETFRVFYSPTQCGVCVNGNLILIWREIQKQTHLLSVGDCTYW